MTLTEEDWKAIHNPDLTREEVYQTIGKKANAEEFKQLLINTKHEERNFMLRRFSSIFWRMPNSLSHSEMENLCGFLLIEKWHGFHEHIVVDFQIKFNDNPGNIQYIESLIDNLPAQFDDDGTFKYPFIRKCMYAIAAQPETESTKALIRLSQHTDEMVRGYALHQLEKQKRK